MTMIKTTTNDPVADMITRIRNAGMAEHRFLELRWSKIKEAMAKILKAEGFIEDFSVQKEGTLGTLQVVLKYDNQRRPVITGLKRVSRPGRRRFVGSKEIPFVFGGMGIALLSTSQGVMTGRQARKQGIGGELLCQVW